MFERMFVCMFVCMGVCMFVCMFVSLCLRCNSESGCGPPSESEPGSRRSSDSDSVGGQEEHGTERGGWRVEIIN